MNKHQIIKDIEKLAISKLEQLGYHIGQKVEFQSHNYQITSVSFESLKLNKLLVKIESGFNWYIIPISRAKRINIIK